MGRFIGAFTSWRVAVMIPLGFASGLPNPVTGSTLGAWMQTAGVSMTTIGLFSLVSLPYNFKFLWSPLFDRFRLPLLGRRRGWMIALQLLLLVGVGVMGSIDPNNAPLMLAGMAVAVAFLSASHDIVTDAFRTDVLEHNERASGTAVFVAAYRGALIVAGAGALMLSEVVSWTVVYWALAGLMAVGMVGTWLAPEPRVQPKPPASLAAAVVDPLREFFRRDRALLLLVVVMLYKVGDAVAGHMLIPFLLEVGFSRAEVGAIAKGLGLAMTIVGALAGGGLVARWGLKRALIVFGVLQAVANVLYGAIAVVGQDHTLLVVSIGVDNLCNGLGTAAFVALLMSLCNKRFTATQYALLSSAATVPGRLLGASGGWVADTAGWPVFFAASVLLAVPALYLLTLVRDTDLEPPGEVVEPDAPASA